jgi:general secretion pathway protein D
MRLPLQDRSILRRPRWCGAALTVLVAALSGCAGPALEEAQRLIDNDQLEAGLSRLRSGLSERPQDPQLRAALLQARQITARRRIAQAVAAEAAGHRAEALAFYDEALRAEPQNYQAQAALARIAQTDRHDTVLVTATAALAGSKSGDRALARSLIDGVLAENPRHARALALQYELDELEVRHQTAARWLDNQRKPITIEFKDATIKQVFDVIGRSSGLNVLFDRDVKLDQKVSISLTNGTVDSALYYVLTTAQLDKLVLDGNTLLIYPNTAAKQRDYQPMVVRTFVLNNANAKAVAETLRTLVKTRDIVVDDKLNMLIVRDSADAVRLADKLVRLQDRAEPEVMLEVEVLEISRARLTELGVTWPTGATLSPLSANAAAGAPLTLADLRGLTRNTVGVAIDPLKLSARGVDSDTNLLANPRIRVLNREKARVMIGNRVPSITTSVIATGIVSESVSYIDVGLKLEVEPLIYVDNDVSIKLSLEVSNIVDTSKSDKGSLIYTIGTRSASTTLRLKDGENQILAGLINDEDRRTANKVPGLGALPLAGRLFGSSLDEAKKSEIVLSITPRLIRNNTRPNSTAAEFSSGTEGSLRLRPSTSADVAMQPAAGAGPAPRPADGAPSTPGPAAPPPTAPSATEAPQTKP